MQYAMEIWFLPPHGYILYIGIAGRNSDRSLQERYKDYLNTPKVVKRDRIARMIGNWHNILCFFYAPIEDGVSSEELQELEKIKWNFCRLFKKVI